jgi:hypothetical protein
MLDLTPLLVLSSFCGYTKEAYKTSSCCGNNSKASYSATKFHDGNTNHQSTGGIFQIAKLINKAVDFTPVGQPVAENTASWWGGTSQNDDFLFTCADKKVKKISKVDGTVTPLPFEGSACRSAPTVVGDYAFTANEGSMFNTAQVTLTKLNHRTGAVEQSVSLDSHIGLTSVQTDFHWMIRGPWSVHRVENDMVCGAGSSRMILGIGSFQYATGIVQSSTPQMRAGGYYYQQPYVGRITCVCSSDISIPCWDLEYADGVKRPYHMNGYPYVLPDLHSQEYVLPPEMIKVERSEFAGSVGHISDCEALNFSPSRLIFSSVKYTYTGTTTPSVGDLLKVPRSGQYPTSYYWTQYGIDMMVPYGLPNTTSPGDVVTDDIFQLFETTTGMSMDAQVAGLGHQVYRPIYKWSSTGIATATQYQVLPAGTEVGDVVSPTFFLSMLNMNPTFSEQVASFQHKQFDTGLKHSFKVVSATTDTVDLAYHMAHWDHPTTFPLAISDTITLTGVVSGIMPTAYVTQISDAAPGQNTHGAKSFVAHKHAASEHVLTFDDFSASVYLGDAAKNECEAANAIVEAFKSTDASELSDAMYDVFKGITIRKKYKVGEVVPTGFAASMQNQGATTWTPTAHKNGGLYIPTGNAFYRSFDSQQVMQDVLEASMDVDQERQDALGYLGETTLDYAAFVGANAKSEIPITSRFDRQALLSPVDNAFMEDAIVKLDIKTGETIWATALTSIDGWQWMGEGNLATDIPFYHTDATRLLGAALGMETNRDVDANLASITESYVYAGTKDGIRALLRVSDGSILTINKFLPGSPYGTAASHNYMGACVFPDGVMVSMGVALTNTRFNTRNGVANPRAFMSTSGEIIYTGSTVISAWDPHNKAVLWETIYHNVSNVGTLTCVDDVVLYACTDKLQLCAFDSRSGKIRSVMTSTVSMGGAQIAIDGSSAYTLSAKNNGFDIPYVAYAMSISESAPSYVPKSQPDSVLKLVENVDDTPVDFSGVTDYFSHMIESLQSTPSIYRYSYYTDLKCATLGLGGSEICTAMFGSQIGRVRLSNALRAQMVAYLDENVYPGITEAQAIEYAVSEGIINTIDCMVTTQAGVDAMSGYGFAPPLQVNTIMQGNDVTRIMAFMSSFGVKMTLEQFFADMNSGGDAIRCSLYY